MEENYFNYLHVGSSVDMNWCLKITEKFIFNVEVKELQMVLWQLPSLAILLFYSSIT